MIECRPDPDLEADLEEVGPGVREMDALLENLGEVVLCAIPKAVIAPSGRNSRSDNFAGSRSITFVSGRGYFPGLREA